MSPRAYRLGARTAAVEDNRQRIAVAARDLFADDGFHHTSLDDVARRADVARATVYHQFGSKLGLLEAVLEDFEARAGLAALGRLVEEAAPDRLLRRVVTAGCRYWSTDPELCRNILGLASTDPAMRGLLDRHDEGRAHLLGLMVARLASAGLLRRGVTRARAVDVVWLLTSFDAYDLLARGRGLSPSSVGRVLADLAEQRLG